MLHTQNYDTHAKRKTGLEEHQKSERNLSISETLYDDGEIQVGIKASDVILCFSNRNDDRIK